MVEWTIMRQTHHKKVPALTAMPWRWLFDSPSSAGSG